MRSGGLESSFFVRFGKPPARLAFIPGQMGHTSPMTRRGDAKKGTADFGPFQSISPQGRPCGDLSTDSRGPHARGPAWRCMWPLCSPGPGGCGRPGWGSVVGAWHAPHALPMGSLWPARLVALPETQPHLTRAHTAMKRAAGGTGRGLCMHMAGDWARINKK